MELGHGWGERQRAARSQKDVLSVQGVQGGPRGDLSFEGQVSNAEGGAVITTVHLFSPWDKDAPRAHLCQSWKGWPAGTVSQKCSGSKAQLSRQSACGETDRVFVVKANTV